MFFVILYQLTSALSIPSVQIQCVQMIYICDFYFIYREMGSNK